jgi:hypothetical protein
MIKRLTLEPCETAALNSDVEVCDAGQRQYCECCERGGIERRDRSIGTRGMNAYLEDLHGLLTP